MMVTAALVSISIWLGVSFSVRLATRGSVLAFPTLTLFTECSSYSWPSLSSATSSATKLAFAPLNSVLFVCEQRRARCPTFLHAWHLALWNQHFCELWFFSPHRKPSVASERSPVVSWTHVFWLSLDLGLVVSCLSLLTVSSFSCCRSDACFSATSIAVAVSNAFLNVKDSSLNRWCCILDYLTPHTRRSHNCLSKDWPKLQCSASLRRSATKSATLSLVSACCYRIWSSVQSQMTMDCSAFLTVPLSRRMACLWVYLVLPVLWLVCMFTGRALSEGLNVSFLPLQRHWPRNISPDARRTEPWAHSSESVYSSILLNVAMIDSPVASTVFPLPRRQNVLYSELQELTVPWNSLFIESHASFSSNHWLVLLAHPHCHQPVHLQVACPDCTTCQTVKRTRETGNKYGTAGGNIQLQTFVSNSKQWEWDLTCVANCYLCWKLSSQWQRKLTVSNKKQEFSTKLTVRNEKQRAFSVHSTLVTWRCGHGSYIKRTAYISG